MFKKKKTTLFLLSLFLFSTFFTTSQSAHANPMLASELIKQEARKYCFNTITFSDQSSLEDSYFDDSYFDDTNFVTFSEDEYEELLKNYDSNNDNQTITNELPSSTTYAKPPLMFAEKTAKTKAGSTVVLPTVNHTLSYGYCHIFKNHMDKANYTQGYTATVGKERKSQFVYAHASDKTMDIVIEVLNATDVLSCDPKKITRCTKEGYSKTAGSKSKVAIHRGHDWKGYEKYNWVVVSAYPRFK